MEYRIESGFQVSLACMGLWLTACSGGEPAGTSGSAGGRDPGASLAGGATSSTARGGASGGGHAATAGTAAPGGVASGGSGNPSGGTTSSSAGGMSAGGMSSTAGVTNAGGQNGTAGITGSGGLAGGGGMPGTAGNPPTAGTASTGGTTSTGGTAGSAGSSATGGISGAAGAAGTSGSATPDCNSVTGQVMIQVAANGSQQYATVQAALDSIASSNTTPTQIRIQPGTYREKLLVNKPFVTLCGQAGMAASTVLTYSDNANTPNGAGGTLGTSGSASINLSASNVSAENITFENSTALGGSQAVALLVTGSQVQFRNCRFMSYQDTLYVSRGTQYFRNCYVQGSVDFIFGASTAVFEGCTVHSAAGGVSVTAPSTDQLTSYGLVFLGGSLTAASSVARGSVALGRNWRPYGATTYLATSLGSHINPVGWLAMGTNILDTARFAEYRTTGEGASAANLALRAPQSRQLTTTEAAAYTIPNIFGTWTPSFSR